MRGGGGGSGRGTERGHEPPHLVAAVQVHFLLLVHAIERSLRGGRRHEAPAAYGCSTRLPIPTASLIQSRWHAVHKVQRVARCAADSRAVTSKCGDHAALRLDVCLPFHELSTLVLASVLLLCLLLSLPYSFLGHRIPRRPWLNDEEGESASRRGEKGVVVDAYYMHNRSYKPFAPGNGLRARQSYSWRECRGVCIETTMAHHGVRQLQHCSYM